VTKAEDVLKAYEGFFPISFDGFGLD
jgi:hypothetical protein